MVAQSRVLHVVVGHGLPTHFLNAVDSVRILIPDADLLVVDNASRDEHLAAELAQRAADDARLTLVVRPDNEIGRNSKVGGLYEAYRAAFAHAGACGYDFVHLLQGDMQVVWWDDDVIARAIELYASHPACVNIAMGALSEDKELVDEYRRDASGATILARYGITDTGMYSLPRWRAAGLQWADHEAAHARAALLAGHEVLLHPWPTDVQVPWPPVIRNGRQHGREVRRRHPLLCRPLNRVEIDRVRVSPRPAVLEEICIPWGWWCLAPMWITDLDSLDYWVLRWKSLRRGIRRSRGRRGRHLRLVTGGLPGGVGALVRAEHRPPLTDLLLRPPVGHLRRRLALFGGRAG